MTSTGIALQPSFQNARQALTHSPFLSGGATPLAIQPLPKLELQADWAALRARALEEAQSWLALERANTRAYFERSGNALRTLRQYSDVIDQLLTWLLKLGMKQAESLGQLSLASESDKHGPALALIAVGGYGRRELFPHSDLDIMVLHGGTLGASLEGIAQFVYYVLWDLGFKVGQAVYTLSEAMEAATTTHPVLTSLLDARLVSGQRRLLTRLVKQLQEQAGEERVRR